MKIGTSGSSMVAMGAPLRMVCSPSRFSAARRIFMMRFSSSAWLTPFDH